MKKTIQAHGKLTNETHMVMGELSPVVVFDCPKPDFINYGYAHYEAPTFQVVELDATPAGGQIPHLGFQDWVWGKFTDGERGLFLHPASMAWDDTVKRFTKPIYRVVG